MSIPPNDADALTALEKAELLKERLKQNSQKAEVIPFKQDQAPSEGKVYEFLSIDDIFNMPNLEYQIEGIIPQKSFTMVYGPTGSLKSFVMLDMSLSIAYGLDDWQGKKVGQGGVLYIAAEGKSGFKQRIRAWQINKGIEKDAKAPFYLHGMSVNMCDFSNVIEFCNAITLKLHATGNKGIKMIVIDTLNRNFAGDENSQNDMSKFIKGCELLQQHLGVTVVAVHHTGKDVEKGARGSSVMEAGVDTALVINKDHKDHIKIGCRKQKDGSLFEPFALHYKEIETEYGNSLVLNSAVAGFKMNDDDHEDDQKEQKTDALIMELLKHHYPNGLTIKRMTELLKINDQKIRRHVGELETSEAIQNDGSARDKKYYLRLGLKDNRSR